MESGPSPKPTPARPVLGWDRAGGWLGLGPRLWQTVHMNTSESVVDSQKQHDLMHSISIIKKLC